MTTTAGKTVLISGINGYLAAVIAKAFLDAGFRVRGTTRSKASTEILTEGPLKEQFEAGQFEIVEVPDITSPGAFDAAVSGVHAVLHTAAPVSFSFTDPEPVMHAAINGTVSILNSTLNAGPQLKTVVFMSSIAAVFSPKNPPYTYTEADWNDTSEKEVEQLGKEASGAQIYTASKTAAERAFWAFRKEHQPTFAMTAINPVFVTGPPLAPPKDPKKITETVRNVWQIFSGQDLPPPLSPVNNYVDVRDVARLFLWSVEHSDQANGERYIAHGGAGSEQRIADVLREHYPERRDLIKKGTPGQYPPDIGLGIDSTKASTAMGHEFTPFDKSVLDAAKAFEVYL